MEVGRDHGRLETGLRGRETVQQEAEGTESRMNRRKLDPVKGETKRNVSSSSSSSLGGRSCLRGLERFRRGGGEKKKRERERERTRVTNREGLEQDGYDTRREEK